MKCYLYAYLFENATNIVQTCCNLALCNIAFAYIAYVEKVYEICNKTIFRQIYNTFHGSKQVEKCTNLQSIAKK